MTRDDTIKLPQSGKTPARADQPEQASPGEPPASRDIPTGRFNRFMKLSALSAGASTRYFGQKVKGLFQEPEARAEALLKTHLKTAQKTVEVMGHLKGAVMKVGQMISLHPENGILPSELTTLFNKLHNEAPTLPYSAIREAIVRELGQPPEALFLHFDEAPLAAASLGQVHAAQLHDGREVVVKIQYPGIDRTVESDLWQLRAVFKASGLVGRAEEADRILEEVRNRLVEELDYRLEAQNLGDFAALFADEPRLIVPRPVLELSAQRVLTMERLHGYTFEEILLRHPDQAWRNQLGVTLFALLLDQVFTHQRLHADPQLGNYRFLDDGRVIMLDLGCVKSFDDRFLEPYLSMIVGVLENDRARTVHSLEALGIVPGDDADALRLVLEFAGIVLEPLRQTPYCFADEGRMMERLKVIGPKFLLYPQIQGHTDLVYLHRTYVGMYFMLTRLKASADWRAMFEQQRQRLEASS